ncbi:hypothetical protein TRIP_C20201 [Candidatus Zixiibacteriota bacterium]|nr:hypothetical protein TRIP_C20201 [candidate division Zixibacteria bacterium]
MDKHLTPKRISDIWKSVDEDGGATCKIMAPRGIFHLDAIAAMVWRQCDGRTSIASIIEAMGEAFPDIEPDTISDDITELLKKLSDDYLIILNYHPLRPYADDKVIHAQRQIRIRESDDPECEFLLIVPPSPHPLTPFVNLSDLSHLGCGYLSAVLKDDGFKVKIYNFWNKECYEADLIKIIGRHRPRVVGLTTMTENYENGVLIARVIKEADPSIIVIMGGPHVTFTDRQTLERTPIDIIARGEGEQTIIDLARYFIRGEGSLENIPGISYRNGNGFIRNPDRPFIADLDTLPFPDRKGIRTEYTRSFPVISSRGCPHLCHFCAAGAMSGCRYRKRNPELVVEEIKRFIGDDQKFVFFQDDNFTADAGRMFKILEIMKLRDINVTWTAESRVTIAEKDPGIFGRMKALGCYALQFGIESGSQEILDRVNKRITLEQIERGVRLASEAGIAPACSFIIGHPDDTPDTVEATIKLAERLQADYGALAGISLLVPYPGTYLANNLEQFGLTLHSRNYDDYHSVSSILSSDKLSLADRKRFYYDAMIRTVKTRSSKYRLNILAPAFVDQLFPRESA